MGMAKIYIPNWCLGDEDEDEDAATNYDEEDEGDHLEKKALKQSQLKRKKVLELYLDMESFDKLRHNRLIITLKRNSSIDHLLFEPPSNRHLL